MSKTYLFMHNFEVEYAGEMQTKAVHLKAGLEIITDAPTDNYGKGQAFSPTDLLATSLACCMMTIMGIKARNSGFEFAGAKAEVTKIMASNPRRVAEVVIKFQMTRANYSDEQKRFLKNAALNCPVAKSIHPDLKQTVSFEY